MPMRLVRSVNGRFLTGALVGSVAVLIGAGALAYSSSQHGIEANQAEIERTQTVLKVLCLQREDLDNQITHDARALQRSSDFLRNHPHGIPGIPASLIKAGIKDDQATLEARLKFWSNLNILDC